MKFLFVFAILTFLAGCQYAGSSQNNIKDKKLSVLKNKAEGKNSTNISKKQLTNPINNTIENKSSTIREQLNKCQKKIDHFDNKTNEYFTKSIFLYNLKQLETIVIYYKDIYKNEQKSKIKPIKYIFEDDFLIISEKKEYSSLNIKGIKLVNPSSIYFLNIKYIDRDDKPQYKPVCINVENRKIENNNLFLYENKYYFHDALLKNKKQHTKKSKLNFEKVPSHSSLKVFYSEDDKYFYLKILGCEENYACKEPKYIKRPKDKIIVFKFSLNGNYTQRIQNFSSKHIKRIEVGFQGGSKENNHLVIESKEKKITNITKMYFNNKEKSSNKELIYKIEF